MSEDQYKLIFSKNLKYYMELNQKTQIDLVNDLGFNKSAVSTWVNGTRLPRMDKVDQLARYLGISRSDLIESKSHSDSSSDYYIDPETARVAQELHDDPNLRILFDAARDAKPETLRAAAEMIKALKSQYGGD